MDSPWIISADVISDLVSITWFPPFTLDGIVIHEYKVNVIARNDSTIIRHEEHSTETENITFPLVDQSVCTVYDSSIQAISDAGLGHASIANMTHKYEGKWVVF